MDGSVDLPKTYAEEDPFNYQFKVDIPSYAFKGHYRIQFNFYDSNNKSQLCLNIEMDLWSFSLSNKYLLSKIYLFYIIFLFIFFDSRQFNFYLIKKFTKNNNKYYLIDNTNKFIIKSIKLLFIKSLMVIFILNTFS